MDRLAVDRGVNELSCRGNTLLLLPIAMAPPWTRWSECRRADEAVTTASWAGAGSESSMLDGDGASPVELPVATAPPLDRSRVWTVGNSDGGKPRNLSL